MKFDSLSETLAATELFGDLSAASLARIAQQASIVRAVTGQAIVNAGDQDAHLYLVQEGAIKLAVVNVVGNEKTIATLDAPKCFGLAEIFSGSPFYYYAEALTRSRLICVPGRAIKSVGEHDSRLLLNLLRSLGQHFMALAHEIENAHRYSAFQRVVNYLLMHAHKRDDDTAMVRLPGKKIQLASRLGVAPETLSRSLAALTDQGMITVRNHDIVLERIADLQTLLESSGLEPEQ